MRRCLNFTSLIFLFSLATFPPLSQATETVTLQLKWQHQFQFAGYYAAQHFGFYQEAGLDVDIREAGPGIDSMDVVLNGEAEYGVGNSSILLSRSTGAPLVVLAVIMQHSPFVLLTRQESTLGGIQDLSGKRLMIEPLADEIVAFLNHEGLPLDSFEQVLENPHHLDAFINGDVDAIDAYSTDEPYQLMRQGVAFNIYHPRSAGIDFYGDNLFTSEDELVNHPDRVRRFRAASLRGWRYAMSHKEEMIELILKNYPKNLDRDSLTYESQQMQQLILPELIDIGYMHSERWRRIADTYASLGMLPENVSLDGLMYNDINKPNLQWFYATTALTVFVLSIVIFLNIRFSRLNHQLSSLLHIKSRFANIGESINNISHQWKQPLNELAIQLMLLEQLASDPSLPDQFKNKISQTTAKSHTLLEFMANTVDVFSHLLRTSETQSVFSPHETVEEVISLISDTFRLHKITLDYTSRDTTQIHGNPTEFAHALLTILNNARDIIDERKIDPAFINIHSYCRSDCFYLEIGDNAGGVNTKPLDKIFTLGFSAKQPGYSGSGVGLYIAKEIIEERFKGSINVQNGSKGAIFTIAIPCSG